MADTIPFEDRFLVQPPPNSNAQEAATRVYNRGGILVRSDPFVAAVDRKGNSFQQTRWHDAQKTGVSLQQTAQVTQVLEPKDPVARFRMKILQREGAGGIYALGRSFRIMDHDGNHRINVDELQVGLEHFGLSLHKEEVAEIVNIVGKGRPITYDEFLVAIRGTINKRRMKLIDMAYKVLDVQGKGHVTVADIQDRFSAEHHPDVLTGKLPPAEALGHFLANFDVFDHDGVVTEKDFVEYYRNVSASIDDDDYFELMIRNAWHISGGEGWCANTANTRLLVVFMDGAQKVVEIKKDLGLDLKDNAAVMQALKAQGITNVAKFSFTENV